MITRVRHTGIVVHDLEKAVAFYEKLGFELWKREIESGSFLDQLVGIPEAKIETAKMKSPCGSMIELLQYLSHPKQKKIEPNLLISLDVPTLPSQSPQLKTHLVQSKLQVAWLINPL